MIPGFHSLPAEILVMVMTLCHSAQDLLSLTQASPDALSCFRANRQFLIQPYINNLKKILGGHLPSSALLAAHLRCIRQRCAATSSISEIEQQIWPILDQFLPLDKIKIQWPAKLPVICALITLVSEADLMTSRYALDAWDKMQEEPVRYQWMSEEDYQKPLELSLAERRRFHDALFRFECYCQAFFRDEVILFDRDESTRRMFFSMSDFPGPDYDFVESFYSIIWYFWEQHLSILQRLTNSLDARSILYHHRNEVADAAAIINCFGSFTNVSIQSQLRLCRFRYRTRLEMHKYLHYLTSQGIGMLFALQHMGVEAQQEFSLAAFFRVSLSEHPAVLLKGIENCPEGVGRSCKWVAWAYSDWDGDGMGFGWEIASSFWDRKRRRYNRV